MALKLGEAFALVGLKTAPFTKGLTTVRAKFGTAMGKMQAMARRFSGVFGMVLGIGVAAAFAKVIRLAAEQEAVERRLQAVIEATGGAAGYTADELKKMAAALQKVTTYGDEVTISAMAILLTFRNIDRAAFRPAIERSMDLATVMKTDLRSAIVMVGKALNDPMIGLTAMSRAGVTFAKAQQEVIKTLWETGQTAKAQGMILEEMEKQFGGVAEAAAKTTAGGLAQLKNAIGDLGEAFGDELAPYIRQSTEDLMDWTSATTEAAGETDTLEKKVGTLADTLEVSVRIFHTIYSAIAMVVAGTLELAIGIDWLLVKMGQLVGLHGKFGRLSKLYPTEEEHKAFAEPLRESQRKARESWEAMKKGWLGLSPSQRVEVQRKEQKRKAAEEAERRRIPPQLPAPQPRQVGPFAAAMGAQPRWVPKAPAGPITPITSEEEIKAEREAKERALRLFKQWQGLTKELEGIPERRRAAEGAEARARRTPEFSAIADFAKSVQSRIYDKKQVDLTKQLLKSSQMQESILRARLKSIDDSLQAGMVARAG